MSVDCAVRPFQTNVEFTLIISDRQEKIMALDVSNTHEELGWNV